jgi:hypothetical protein
VDYPRRQLPVDVSADHALDFAQKHAGSWLRTLLTARLPTGTLGVASTAPSPPPVTPWI